MPRNPYIDTLKGVLILLVVIGHAIQYGVYHDAGHWGDPFYKAIYLFHMPLFMAVSGFLSRRSIFGKPPLPLAWQRFQAYILPILTWALIAQLSLAPFSSDFSVTRFPHLVVREALESLWFLWCLYGAIVVTIILVRFGKWAPHLAILGYITLLFIPDFFHLHLFKYTLPFFWLGIIAARPQLISKSLWRSPAFALATLLLTIILYILWNRETYIYLELRMSLVLENIPHILIRYAAGFIGSSLALLLLWWTFPRLPQIPQKYLVWLGKNTLPIYIIQGYLFLWISKGPPQLTSFLNPISRITYAIILGVFVTSLAGFLGNLLARHRLTARFLLGITSLRGQSEKINSSSNPQQSSTP